MPGTWDKVPTACRPPVMTPSLHPDLVTPPGSHPIRSDAPDEVKARWTAALVTNGLFGTLAFLILTGRIESTSVGWDRILLGIAALSLLLLVPAVRETARWARFKGTTLVPDPGEGSLGGDVGGRVRIPGPGLRDASFRVYVVCLAARGQGRRSSQNHESVHWIRAVRPRVDPGANGTLLTFSVPLPSELPPTGPSHRWAVRVRATLPGADLDLSFPVRVERHTPPRTSEIPGTTEVPEEPEEERAGRHITVYNSAGTTVLRYRAGRSAGAGLAFVVFGAVFIASGLFAGRSSWRGLEGLADILFSGVGLLFLSLFGFIGVALVLLGLWQLGNGLRVEASPRRIRVRRSFVIPGRTREWATADIEGIETRISGQQLQGSRSRVTYSLRGVTRAGGRIPLGDGIHGPFRLERVAHRLEEATGIPVQTAPTPASPKEVARG